MAGLGVPFFKGFDPRRKTATGEKIARSSQRKESDIPDAPEWPRSLSAADRGEIARAVGTSNELRAERASPGFHKATPDIPVDGEGNIVWKEPKPESGDGIAFLFLHYFGRTL